MVREIFNTIIEHILAITILTAFIFGVLGYGVGYVSVNTIESKHQIIPTIKIVDGDTIFIYKL